MNLRFERTIGDHAFAETGMPTLIRRHPKSELIAVASFFPNTQTNARDIGYRINRVALYDIRSLRCISLFDQCRRRINDFSFHPVLPLVAIASGSYDGGYNFEGDLHIFNYEIGTFRSILPESREVVECRFTNHGRSLEFDLSPPSDEDPQVITRHQTDAFQQDKIDTGPVISETSQQEYWDTSNDETRSTRMIKELAEVASSAGQHYVPRCSIWDMACVSPTQLVFVRNDATLEIADLPSDQITRIHLQDGGQATELFILDSGSKCVVHVFEHPTTRGFKRKSTLHLVNLLDRSLIKSLSPKTSVTVSKTCSDFFLARDTHYSQSSRKSQDFIFDADLNIVAKRLDLGHYDIFNHYVRIDGADELFFLQGMPNEPHRGKQLLSIDPTSLRITSRLRHDTRVSRNGHLTNSCACLCNDAIIVASKTYTRRQSAKRFVIARLSLANGKVIWEKNPNSLVTALAKIPNEEYFAIGTVNGELQILSTSTGESAEESGVQLGSPILSIAASHGHLALGTVDGRIHLFEYGE